ncbi:unnamed protein product [marine sediment metagenome]|uniref:Uncharacterized protein n=1 Tax=marine sediment metagenome TaxID=412755 RepID=X1HHV4_9ZZZZ
MKITSSFNDTHHKQKKYNDGWQKNGDEVASHELGKSTGKRDADAIEHPAAGLNVILTGESDPIDLLLICKGYGSQEAD